MSSSPPPKSIHELRHQLHQSIFPPALNSTEVNKNKKEQKPLPVSLIAPQDFAKLSPDDREQLRRNVKNFTSIASTLAASPSRQTNWHGTYLEPLLDHHNTKLHPSPGPGQYFDHLNNNQQTSTHNCYNNDGNDPFVTTSTSTPSRVKIPPLYPDSASKFTDDYTKKKLTPGPAFYLGFEHISTIEVSDQGEKKRAENVLWKTTNNQIVFNSSQRQHQQHSPKQQQQSSSPETSPKKSVTEKKEKKSTSIFMEKIIEEEKQRKQEHALAHHPNSQNIGVSFASRNEEFHRGAIANVSNMNTTAPGCYETIYSDRTIAGRMNNKFKSMSLAVKNNNKQHHVNRDGIKV